MGHTCKNQLRLEKRVKLNKMGWKCAKLFKMGHIWRNGSHLYKNRPRLKKKKLDLLKWVRFEEMGHTRKNGL